MGSKSQYKFKLVIVGDKGVGKWTMMSKFDDTHWDELSGHSRHSLLTITFDGQPVDLAIQATTGEKSERSKERSTFSHASGFMVVYDYNNRESFKSVPEWMQEIDNYGPKNAIRILVGTRRFNFLSRYREVDYTTAKRYADQHQMMFFETSLTQIPDIQQPFIALAELMKNRVDRPLIASSLLRQDKEILSDIDEGRATDLNNWSKKLKENQESTIKIVGELTARLEKVASSIASVEEKFTAMVNRVDNIEEKFTAVMEKEKEKTAEKEDNSLCKSCEHKVKLRLERECNIL